MTAETAALLACLLSGWPEAEKCHADLVAKGPAAIKEIKPGLIAAMRADPGDGVRDASNAMAASSLRAGPKEPPMPPETKKGHRGPKGLAELHAAEAAAREMGRLGDWKALLALGSTTAAEGLKELVDPPRPVLDALMAWSRGPREKKGRYDRRRSAAVDALKKYGAKAAPALPELIKRLDDEDKRYDALVVIEAMGPAAEPAVPRLGKLIKDNDWHDSAYAALKAIGTPEANRFIDDNPSWTVAPR